MVISPSSKLFYTHIHIGIMYVFGRSMKFKKLRNNITLKAKLIDKTKVQ